MGDPKVSVMKEGINLNDFISELLRDVQALEHMLNNDMFEKDITRVGAEQEMCLVDKKTYKPALINQLILDEHHDKEWLTPELAKFNLETNFTPREFKGKCFSEMEKENKDNLAVLSKSLEKYGAEILLTGILPTLRKQDMVLENLTDKPRYHALMAALKDQLQKEEYELFIEGIDELHIKHDSALLEACNTSFQVHLQVTAQDFANYYNISQMLAAPIMGIACNSPIVFGKRLWHETRIAMFQQSLDTRSTNDHLRERSPRVHFGNRWLDDSILEIYREDIAKFRVLLGDIVEENSIETLKKGGIPRLRALQIHNSTVYRWNRPCYGITKLKKGKETIEIPHLRIENRVLPSGPTVIDEMANAAFWLGAMVGVKNRYPNIRDHISFEDVRDNFNKAAKFGIDSKFTWFKDKKISITDLITKELLPIAREGLKAQKVNSGDIDKYLGIIEERTKAHMNGARWMLRSYTKLVKEVTPDEAVAVMTAAMAKNQHAEIPVHKWEEPHLDALEEYSPSKLKVEEFMQTELFTARSEDPVELVAQIMDWRKIRYMPVEDDKGHIKGLVTSRILLRHFTVNKDLTTSKQNHVKNIMLASPETIGPEATIVEAMNKMRDKKIGCLPVVNKENELIGIITEMDFLRISGSLIQRLEKK
jgi:CBS domain-containing protein